MKLYVIGGKAQSGKNTLAKYIKGELKNSGHKPCLMHITEPLYTYAKKYFEWNERSDAKPREFLQQMGIEVIKHKLGKDTFLLDRIAEDIEILDEFFDAFIISDARLKMEFDYFAEKYPDTTIIIVERKDFDTGLTDKEKNHITETDLDNFEDYDYKVINEGIVNLKKCAKLIVDETKEGE